jgi:hypothetical protein
MILEQFGTILTGVVWSLVMVVFLYFRFLAAKQQPQNRDGKHRLQDTSARLGTAASCQSDGGRD